MLPVLLLGVLAVGASSTEPERSDNEKRTGAPDTVDTPDTEKSQPVSTGRAFPVATSTANTPSSSPFSADAE